MLFRRFVGVLLSIALCAALVPSQALAESKYAAIVMHADTGELLFNKYPNSRRYPASLTKMMTLYMLFEELEAGRLTLNSKLKVSKRAAGQPASKIGLKSGSTITVEQAINALTIKSANDVATVVAERIGGTEVKFARKMTLKAKQIGMKRTQFRNASGLPNRNQYSTARDLATLSQRLIQDFPQYRHYFKRKSFTFKGRTYKSHNKVLSSFSGADGLKTGYTRASGYNLATTAIRGDNRLIGVVLGGRSSRTRDAHMKKIMGDAYNRIKRNPSLISALNRKAPTPNLKPTTLAALGGTWPTAATLASATPVPSLKPTLMAAIVPAQQNAPTLGENIALQGELALAAEAGKWADIGEIAAAEIAQTEAAATKGRVQREGEGQGDVEAVERDWGIQIGAYNKLALARIRMEEAKTILAGTVPTAEPIIDEVGRGKRNLYRLRIKNMTDKEAENACKKIISSGGDCFGIRARS